jgi:hypothetical protein
MRKRTAAKTARDFQLQQNGKKKEKVGRRKAK